MKTINFYTCDECGSEDVEAKMWYHLNNGTIEPVSLTDEADHWCNDCEDHITVSMNEQVEQ